MCEKIDITEKLFYGNYPSQRECVIWMLEYFANSPDLKTHYTGDFTGAHYPEKEFRKDLKVWRKYYGCK